MPHPKLADDKPAHLSEPLLRRKHPRRSFLSGVGIIYHGIYQVVKGYEIGEGGTAIDLDEPMPEGAMVVLSFQIPRGSFVVAMAEVRSCTKIKEAHYRAGCLFKNIRFEHKREIRTFESARI